MSRYNVSLNENEVSSLGIDPEQGEIYTLVYGWDPPLNTQFVHLERYVKEKTWEELQGEGLTDQEIDEYFDNLPDEVVFAIDTIYTMKHHPAYPDKETWSSTEIIELLKGISKIPEEHRDAIVNERPF